LIRWDLVRTLPELYVVPSAVSLSRGLSDLDKRYPDFVVLPLQCGLYRFVACNKVSTPS
jgi:hypothetical protein